MPNDSELGEAFAEWSDESLAIAEEWAPTIVSGPLDESMHWTFANLGRSSGHEVITRYDDED